MSKHKHADLMALYAQDAMETSEPWARWQCKYPTDRGWAALTSNPTWKENTEYRHKPTLININGYFVPEPLRKAPNYGDPIYVVYSQLPECYRTEWMDTEHYLHLLNSGLVHLDKEAAQVHLTAILSFTKSTEVK